MTRVVFFYLGGSCYNMNNQTGACQVPSPTCPHYSPPVTYPELKRRFLHVYRLLSLKVKHGQYRHPHI